MLFGDAKAVIGELVKELAGLGHALMAEEVRPMPTIVRRAALSFLVPLLAVALALPSAAAGKKFIDSKDAREKDEPQTFLRDYDKLEKGKEADWVWFAEGFDPKSIKTASIPKFTATGKTSEARDAADAGAGYLEQAVNGSNRLPWKVVAARAKGPVADLVLLGNVFNAWEPNAAAEIFGDWMANPGAGLELIGKDRAGKVVFQIRHKARGSTIEDAVENGLHKIVKALESWK